MISVCLIVKNEEKHIEACLDSVAWADQIVVVDSGSTDRTLEKARRAKLSIYQHPFVNFAEQKNFALDQATGDWIFFIDADERVTPALAAEIQETAKNGLQKVFEVRRQTFFLGHRLRFSGTQNDAPVRLFPRGKARFEQPVHETLVTPLPTGRLRNAMLHYTTETHAEYEAKLEHYTDLEILAMKKRGKKVTLIDLLLGPAAKWIKLYLLELGILDGAGGWEFARLSAYYHYVKCRKFLNARS